MIHENMAMGTVDAVRNQRVLVVDDDEVVLRTIGQILGRTRVAEIRTMTDPRRVLSLLHEYSPDLILIDLHMPAMDGFVLLRQITARIPEGTFLPVLVLSGDLAADAKQKALTLGASDFVAKPFDAVELQLRVRNLLRLRHLTAQLHERIERSISLNSVAELEHVSRLALVAEWCDYGDGSHVQRVGRASALIAERLGLGADYVQRLRYAAPLHDIGKIAIPDHILLKPAGLTPEEWDVLKRHTTIGAEMFAGSRSPILQMAEEISLYHHENWDGTGYTPGVAGEDIPLAARIVSAADVFDALTHQRPYKRAWSVEEAAEEIETMRGTKFDPAVVDAMFAVLATQDLARLDPADEALDYSKI